MAEACNVLNLAFTVGGQAIGVVSLIHAALREVPSTIVKFRIAYTISALLYAIQVFDSVLNGPTMLQVFIGHLSPARLWAMVLYFLENYAKIWASISIALGPPSRAAERVHRCLQCFPYFRAVLVPYGIAMAATFLALHQNWTLIAVEMSHMVAYFVVLAPGLLLIAHLVIVLSKESSISSNGKDMELVEPSRTVERSKQESPSSSTSTWKTSWQTSQNSRIRSTLRHMVVFLVVTGVALVLSVANSVFIIQDTLALPPTGQMVLEGHAYVPGQFDMCGEFVVVGMIARHVGFMIAVFVSRAPSAKPRRWSKTLATSHRADRSTAQTSKSSNQWASVDKNAHSRTSMDKTAPSRASVDKNAYFGGSMDKNVNSRASVDMNTLSMASVDRNAYFGTSVDKNSNPRASADINGHSFVSMASAEMNTLSMIDMQSMLVECGQIRRFETQGV